MMQVGQRLSLFKPAKIFHFFGALFHLILVKNWAVWGIPVYKISRDPIKQRALKLLLSNARLKLLWNRFFKAPTCWFAPGPPLYILIFKRMFFTMSQVAKLRKAPFFQVPTNFPFLLAPYFHLILVKQWEDCGVSVLETLKAPSIERHSCPWYQKPDWDDFDIVGRGSGSTCWFSPAPYMGCTQKHKTETTGPPG